MSDGCKYLDFEQDKYVDCKIVEIDAPGGERVRCWERTHVPYPEAPRLVQFCGMGRGRINNPLACYGAPGPCGCYVPPPTTRGTGPEKE